MEVVSVLQGGLGNQMFQYAAARALSLEYSSSLKLDTKWYEKEHISTTTRNYELSIFGIVNNGEYGFRSNIRKIFCPSTFIEEPHFHFWPDFFKRRNGVVKLKGYWQSPKYFDAIRTTILNDFSFPDLESKKNIVYLNKIKESSNSVSLHVRRGDYVTNESANIVHGTCSVDYYNEAISHIIINYDNPDFFVFSDDIEWVKSNIDIPNSCYITGNEEHASYIDMQLMSQCNHHIIANSSFSWWGAWLSKNNGLVIAPKKWFSDENVDTSDLYCEGWLRL